MSTWREHPGSQGMLRGPLYQDAYRPQLSGHETFPLRYGWLKKAFDAVRETENGTDNRAVFLGDDAIARFGVGKNMVASMRHWATATGIIEDEAKENRIITTQLGRRLLSDDGFDPYMENPATSWLIHWHLCGRPNKTTWFWAFNYYPTTTFERDTFVQAIKRLAANRGWPRASATTIKNDVACFVRTYVAQRPSGQVSHEDTLESPLTELGLIKPVGRRDGFRFVRGQKPTLGIGAFSYAVTDYWHRLPTTAQTLSFEALAHDPGSPGRVFLLNEDDMVDMLSNMEEVSRGIYRWSETAGLKQITRNRELATANAIDFIKLDYAFSHKRDTV